MTTNGDDGGVARRSEIDGMTVTGLQLMNGGSAAALGAMLPNVLATEGFKPLALWMLVAIALNALGLSAAVVHNRLRRKCSLEYSKAKDSRGKPYQNRTLKWCASVPGEPRICTRSVIFLWISHGLFVLGLIAVMVGGIRIIGRPVPSPAECWELREIDSKLIRVDRCSGSWSVVPLTETVR